jgi:hypothetical protein
LREQRELEQQQAAECAENGYDNVPTTSTGAQSTSVEHGQAANRNGKVPPLTPGAEEIVAAVASLYLDQLKPFGRILRKRIAERHAADDTIVQNGPVLADVNIAHLRGVCEGCPTLKVEPEEGGDWSVTLFGCPATFVDIYDPVDAYSEQMWASFTEYLEKAPPEDTTLPGGRYSCARTLLSRGLACLANRTLGQVCHIVQLAISDRKVLGYLNGAVVPYERSQSMMKEKCALQQQACANMCAEAASLEFATWESGRTCLKTILSESSTDNVPLSNIKRMFRSQFQLELSETVLGHSKLSELLQDQRFGDICMVELEGHGYTVWKRDTATTALPMSSSSPDDQKADEKAPFCQDDPLSLEEAGVTLDLPFTDFGQTPLGFGPTPMPSPWPNLQQQTNQQDEQSFLTHVLPLYLQEAQYHADESTESCCHRFCPDEPLLLEDASDIMSTTNYYFAQALQWPGLEQWDSLALDSMMAGNLFDSIAATNQSSHGRYCSTLRRANSLGSLKHCEDVMSSETASSSGCSDGYSKDAQKCSLRQPHPHYPSLSPWKDGKLNGMVRNTFIHSCVPPPTPLVGAVRRSMSVPSLSVQQGQQQPQLMLQLSSATPSPQPRVGTPARHTVRVISLADHLNC